MLSLSSPPSLFGFQHGGSARAHDYFNVQATIAAWSIDYPASRRN